MMREKRGSAYPLGRRDFVKAYVISAALLAGIGPACVSPEAGERELSTSPTAQRPNILILESDQHMPGAMSCAGHKIIKTPSMDRLARDGVMFRRAVCPSPVCKPSRTAMLTGRYPHQNGVLSNRDNGDENFIKRWTFPRELQQAGYFTGLIGKTHFPHRNLRSDMDALDYIAEIQAYGFDSVFSSLGKVTAGSGQKDCPYTRYLKEKGLYEIFSKDMMKRHPMGKHAKQKKDAWPRWYSEPSPLSEEDFHDVWISRQAAKWIENYQDNKPFMLWVNWGGPHAPWDAPRKYHSMYDPKDVELPYDDPREGYPKGTYSMRRGGDTDEQSRAVRTNYYGLINVVDDGIGQIVDVLKKRGMLENTIVIYTSDHGEMLGNHGKYAKAVMYSDSVNVPMIVSCPKRFVRGTKIETPVNTLDLIPTILQVAGIPIAKGVEGKSLVPILTGETTKHKEAVFSEIDSNGKQHTKMVLWDRYKYICCDKWTNGKTRFKALLFDLTNDPRELNNLSGRKQYAELERKLAAMIEDWQSR